jgi:hypothetical protein
MVSSTQLQSLLPSLNRCICSSTSGDNSKGSTVRADALEELLSARTCCCEVRGTGSDRLDKQTVRKFASHNKETATTYIRASNVHANCYNTTTCEENYISLLTFSSNTKRSDSVSTLSSMTRLRLCSYWAHVRSER